MIAVVKPAVALLVLLLVGCSSSTPSPPEPDRTWLGMVPGDARAFDGPVQVETPDGVYAS